MAKRKRVYSKSISDHRVLEMILANEIVITDYFTTDPELRVRGRFHTPQIHRGRRNERYCWKLHDKYDEDGVRHIRTICRNKLVWMTWHRRIVPDGHQLHHRDEDRFNDAINNIELKTDADHNAHHYDSEF